MEVAVPDKLAGYLRLPTDEDLSREVGYYVLGKMERVGFASLSGPEQIIGCLTELEMEVNNGGFHQYYWNSPGDHARETVEALRTLRAHNTAELVIAANAVFGPEGPSADREQRWKQLEALGDRATTLWFDFDGGFFEYKDNLPALAATFIRANKAAFTPYGE
jgi:hypothetical protein